MNKELKEIIRRIEEKGFSVVPAGKHLKVKNAASKTVYTLPTSPTGSRWKIRLLHDLKKRGLIE